jgi:putative DNA primase/helicase
VNVAAIPAELRDRPQWVCWKLEQRDGKQTKVPYRADGAGRASATDSQTWTRFEVALEASARFDGVGFVFSVDDPFVGIDLDEVIVESDPSARDHCIGENGDSLHPEAAALVLRLDSYTEISPSGRGLKVIVRAGLNGFRRNRTIGPWGYNLEVYDKERYFTITGAHLTGMPEMVEPRQQELQQVLELTFGDDEPPEPRPAQPVDLDDRDLLGRAMRAKNGAKFERLWSGDTTGYPSRSEADLALCSLLAFWTGRDRGRIDSMFRSSGLYREAKWGRDDYRERTIETAIAATQEIYQERTRGQKSVESVAQKTDSLTETERNGLTDSALKESVGPESVPSRGSQSDATDSEPESVAVPERPFALSIREFIVLEREQREPLLADVDGRAVVGRNSLTLCGALGGHGKTTWFVDVALHMAAGIDYPPFTVPRPVSILMIENEGPEELFAKKLKARLASFSHELKAHLDVCTFDWGGFSLADDAQRERLNRAITAKGYDLVFGDPLDSLGIDGVGSPEDTRKFLALMKETGLNKRVAWWLNTHPRKEDTKEALHEIAGAWGGKPDSVFLLRMLNDDRTQIRQPKLRWARRGKGPTLLLAFDPDTEAFTFIGEESEEERDYLAEIARLLANGRWRTAKEIAAPTKDGGIGANVDTIKKVLEEHPDVFELRTGEGAKALGRSTRASVWQLHQEPAS